MERLTVFDGEFWGHKNFPPVAEFLDCVKELAELPEEELKSPRETDRPGG